MNDPNPLLHGHTRDSESYFALVYYALGLSQGIQGGGFAARSVPMLADLCMAEAQALPPGTTRHDFTRAAEVLLHVADLDVVQAVAAQPQGG